MTGEFVSDLAARLETLKSDGLFRHEQVIASPQQGAVTLENGTLCINLCANNYLGLANHSRLIEATRDALDRYGFGMSSVRSICGTQLPHKRLEARLSAFPGTDDTILFPSCFDADAGRFETLLGPEDAVVYDAGRGRGHGRGGVRAHRVDVLGRRKARGDRPHRRGRVEGRNMII